MEIRYGANTRPAGEVYYFYFSYRPRQSRRGRRESHRIDMRFRGEIRPDPAAPSIEDDLTAKIQELVTNWSFDNQGDMGLYDSSGNATPHIIENAHPNNMTGVVIASRQYPWIDTCEYSNHRNYEIAAYADFFDIEDQLTMHESSLTTIGTGGPVFKVQHTQNNPVKVDFWPTSSQIIIQEGRAFGMQATPVADAPLFPALEHVERRMIRTTSPQENRRANSQYGISWRYEFEDPTP